MSSVSNKLIVILSFLTLLVSIPILGSGIWLAHKGSTHCEKFLEKPIVFIGVFLLVVSLASLIGACFRISWMLWVYLLVPFLLITLLFCFTFFALEITKDEGGRKLSNRGYEEYKLGDYSNWFQKRVSDGKNWNKIKSCLIDEKVCESMATANATTPTVTEFYKERLSAIQSGCCKPADECHFVYVSPTVWTKPTGAASTNPDCASWDNNASTLCFNCGSCKAGFVDKLNSDWERVAIFNAIFYIMLVIVNIIGLRAWRNGVTEKSNPRYSSYA